MSDEPMFFFAGVYDDAADAEYDYVAVKALHSASIIGSYDSVIVHEDMDGRIKVTKAEKPTQPGGWLGLAAGGAVAVAAPVAMPALLAAGGAGLGAWAAQITRGISQADLRELGETLEDGTAVLIVVGIDRDADRVQRAASKVRRFTIKRVAGDYEQAEHEAKTVMAV
jgi:uncharacterized membrane protein